jgi:hypothetical protein
MKLDVIVDSIVRNVQGGKNNQGSVLDPQYVKSMIHSYRAIAIKQEFKRTGIIQPTWIQTCYLSYSKDLQFSAPQGAVLFNFPSIISVGDEDGIRFIGSIGGGNQNQAPSNYPCSKTWNRVWSRGELATINQNSFMRFSNNPNTVYVLYDFTQNRLEVYNDMLVTEGRVEAIFANPSEICNGNGIPWNETTDEYPIDEGALSVIKTLIYEQRTAIDKATPPEINSNTPEVQPTRPPFQKQPQVVQ